jgi:hypothetical protein
MSPRLLLRLRFVAVNDNLPPPGKGSSRWFAILNLLGLLAIGLLAEVFF